MGGHTLKNAQMLSCSLGVELEKNWRDFGVPIYYPQLAVCVSTTIESMIPEQELSLRVLVSSRSNLVAFGEHA
jgi:hypothetical protein